MKNISHFNTEVHLTDVIGSSYSGKDKEYLFKIHHARLA